MSMMKTFDSKKYTDGRTKQAFKDECDINRILARAAKGDSIAHLAKHGAVYGDFTDIDDLLTAHNRLKRGQEIFNDLPGEIKREFNQDVGAFFRFVNDPVNKDRLGEVIPGIAKPHDQIRKLNQPPEGGSELEFTGTPERVSENPSQAE